MKPPCSPHLLLCLLFLLPGPGCSADDENGEVGEDGGSPDAAAPISPPDAADPPEPDAAPTAAFILEGDVVGPEIPADAEVVVGWMVTSDGPNYAYKWGDGSSTGPRYVFSLPDEAPPDRAINDYGDGRRIAVGFAILVPTGTDLPDGVLDPEADVTVLGGSPTPIIWREGNLGGHLDWANAFKEAAYQCGRCLPAEEGENYDGFEPSDCVRELEIEAPPPDDGCNWT